MVSLKETRIDAQGDTDTTMTELLLDVFNVGALLNEETGVSVTAIMEALNTSTTVSGTSSLRSLSRVSLGQCS